MNSMYVKAIFIIYWYLYKEKSQFVVSMTEGIFFPPTDCFMAGFHFQINKHLFFGDNDKWSSVAHPCGVSYP